MKNLIKIIFLSFLASPTAFASSLEGFYVRADGGAFVVQGGAKTVSGVRGKVRPKHCAGVVDVGLGYYLTDKFRVELAYGHVFNSKLKGKSYGIDPRDFFSAAPKDMSVNIIGTSKASVNMLMLNGYYDIFNIGDAKIFGGVGIGFAKVKEKVISEIVFESKDDSGTQIYKGYSKHNPNFTYGLSLGVEKKIAEKAVIELVYIWRDFTYTRYRVDVAGKKTQIKTNQFRGHNVLAGFRFNL